MLAYYKKALHYIILIFFALIFSSNTNIAFAQANSCKTLQNTIRSLDRNRDYRSLNTNTKKAKALAAELKKKERTFVRGGCQKLLKAKKKLTGQCRTLARSIIRGRTSLKKLNASIQTGRAIASQRANLTKKINSNTCSQPKPNKPQNNNRSLLDILFGNNKVEITPDVPNIRVDLNTLRTLCVRLSDGYYWPISFSTTKVYLSADEQTCKKLGAPGELEMYYHRNPGEDSDSMINMAGKLYKSLPNAFLFRQKFIPNNTFSRNKTSGFIEVVKSQGQTTSRAIVSFDELSFPMPIRDPRTKTKTTVIATVNIVPLPRSRPYREGEIKPIAKIITPIINAPIKTFISGGKTIRIIGPDTLYAQPKAKDT